MIALSPGLAQGCFELISITSRTTLSFPEIRASFAYLGGMTIGKVIETAQNLNWLRANDDGIATLTPSGNRLLELPSYEKMLRRALLDYIEIEHPAWLQNATYGRARVLSFTSSEIAQVFTEAGLAYGIEHEIVEFWDDLAALARGQKNCRLSAIGRHGERLSIAYEEARTGQKPKWISVDNNEDGYDILSIVSNTDRRYISIEVKASTMGLSGRLYLTRNEWERSQESDNHTFHIWNIQDLASPLLAIITPEQLEEHVPTDSGCGVWKSVEIPLTAFNNHFSSPH